MNITPELKELALREMSRRRLMAYVKYVFPNYDASWHHELMCEKLEQVEAGTIKRLMIFMPPRHGKSELASVQFPAWFLGRNPSKEIINTSYTADLATDFGRRVRNAIASDNYKNIFTTVLSADSTAANKWHTTMEGSYISTGVGGPLTGRGADCFVAGTMVTTNHGKKAIEALQVGERVLSYSHERHLLQYRPVIAKRSITKERFATITTASGRSITGTIEHPIFIPGRGYIKIKDLAVGDRVWIHQGEKVSNHSLFKVRNRIFLSLVRIYQTGKAWSQGLQSKEQQSGESDNGMQYLSYGSPQLVRDTISSITPINQRMEAYDIQVGGNANFFADNISVSNCLLIDDPFKNRQEADSPIIREQVWNWYISTAYTRLSPGGAVILVMCMTGDTPVLMADGTERPLRDIRVGDKVGTWDNGRLSSSFVRNWTSHGDDRVLRITMSSGKIVRANERHPFLINNNGKLVWTRVKNLRIAQQIVTLRHNGENGRGKHVWGLSVNFRRFLGGIVRPITTKKSGPMGIVRHPLILFRVVLHVSSVVMALVRKGMISSWISRVVSVQFANSLQEKMFEPTGVGNFVSTTITTQKKLGHYSATTVTSPLRTQRMQKLRWPWQSISEFTLDSIVSIEEDGVEEVFDIQVDRTENFIANGVVSHNTRWHDDDLAGRLLHESGQGGDKWEVISLPAIATHDEDHRKQGEALWPTRFNLERLQATKAVLGSYDWASLYQQSPLDEDSIEFKREWFKYRTAEEVDKLNTRRFLTVDTAGPMTSTSDYTGWVDNCVDMEGNWNLRAKKYKISSADLVEMLFLAQDKYHYEKIGIEKTIYLDSLKPFLDMEMMKRKKMLPIFELKHGGRSKELRIRGILPQYQAGRVFHVKGECDDLEPQLLRFPKSSEDDVMDAAAYQTQIAETPFGWGPSEFANNQEEGVSSKEKFDPFNPLGSF